MEKIYNFGIKAILWGIFYGGLIYVSIKIGTNLFPNYTYWVLFGSVFITIALIEPVTKSYITSNETLVSLYLKINPFDDDILLTLAKNMQENKPQKAISLCQRGLQINSEDPNKWITLSDSLIDNRYYDEALKVVTLILDYDDLNAKAYNNLGVIFEHYGQFDNAEQEFRKAIEQDKSIALAFNNLSELLINQNRYKEALKTIQEGLLFNSNDKLLEQKKTEILNQMDNEEKLSIMEELVDVFPNTNFREDYGRVLRSMNRSEEAIEQFELILKNKPNDTRIKNLLAVTYADDLGEIDKALSIINNILKDDPEYATAWANKGYYTNKIEDNKEKVLLMYDRALQINPDYQFAIKKKVEILKELNNIEQAIKFLKKKIRRRPKYLSYRVELCQLLQESRDEKKTLKCIKDALGLYYNDDFETSDDKVLFDNIISLAIVLEKISKYNKAILVYKSLLPDYSENAHLLNNLGYCLVLDGQVEQALHHLNESIKIDPEYKYARESLGYAFWKLKKYENALEQYNKALELDPDYKLAKKRKQKLLDEMTSND